jgi:hypothetical protein
MRLPIERFMISPSLIYFPAIDSTATFKTAPANQYTACGQLPANAHRIDAAMNIKMIAMLNARGSDSQVIFSP